MLRCKDVAELVGTDALVSSAPCIAWHGPRATWAFVDVAAGGDVESVIQAVRRATRGTQ